LNKNKINLQARIKRHSRILKDNLWNSLINSKKNNFWYKVISIFVVLFLPIYPMFSYFWTTAESFYRWDIDESSILESYDLSKNSDFWENNSILFDSNDSYLNVWAFVNDDKWEKISNNIIEYTAWKWDNIELIAKKYWVSEDTIRFANNLDKKVKTLKEWQKLVFPSVDWIFYTVKRWDTISSIARKYHIYTKDIVEKNNLWKYLRVWKRIILPWAKPIKEEEKTEEVKKDTKKVYKKKPYIKPVKTYRTKKTYIAPKKIYKNWLYPLRWRKPYSWAWWNCTWYVASYKNVDWRWNANQWLRNARKKWHKTGNYAIPWAIVVLGWRGYNRWYGHVAIVRKVEKNYLIVSDMNYRRLWQVTLRKIKRYWSHIKWYIYVWD